MPVTKMWLVTSGNPRPSHEALDGETIPISEPFSNGLMYPGDPNGGGDETANCQCVLEIDGTATGAADFRTLFGEVRGPKGGEIRLRGPWDGDGLPKKGDIVAWGEERRLGVLTSAPSGANENYVLWFNETEPVFTVHMAEVGKTILAATPKDVAAAFARLRGAVGATRESWLAWRESWHPNISDTDLWFATDRPYASMNRILRAGDTYPKESLSELDDLIAREGFQVPETTLYRGVQRDVMVDMKIGDEFVDRGYVYMTADRDWSAGSFGRGGQMLDIHIPEGTRALLGKQSESELLFGRDLTFKVTDVVTKTNSIGETRVIGYKVDLVPRAAELPQLAKVEISEYQAARDAWMETLDADTSHIYADFDSTRMYGLNGELRTQSVARTEFDYVSTDPIEKLLAAGDPTREGEIFYRGFGSNVDIKVGSTFTDRGYPFASGDPAVGVQFSQEGGSLVKLEVPAGTPRFYGSYDNFTESILPRDMEFTIARTETARTSSWLGYKPEGATVLETRELGGTLWYRVEGDPVTYFVAEAKPVAVRIETATLPQAEVAKLETRLTELVEQQKHGLTVTEMHERDGVIRSLREDAVARYEAEHGPLPNAPAVVEGLETPPTQIIGKTPKSTRDLWVTNDDLTLKNNAILRDYDVNKLYEISRSGTYTDAEMAELHAANDWALKVGKYTGSSQTTADGVVYRGAALRMEDVEKFKIGQVYKDDGFMSVSPKPETARFYGNERALDAAVVDGRTDLQLVDFELKLPAGQRIGVMDEGEWVLQRGQSLLIDGVEKTYGVDGELRWKITATVNPERTFTYLVKPLEQVEAERAAATAAKLSETPKIRVTKLEGSSVTTTQAKTFKNEMTRAYEMITKDVRTLDEVAKSRWKGSIYLQPKNDRFAGMMNYRGTMSITEETLGYSADSRMSVFVHELAHSYSKYSNEMDYLKMPALEEATAELYSKNLITLVQGSNSGYRTYGEWTQVLSSYQRVCQPSVVLSDQVAWYRELLRTPLLKRPEWIAKQVRKSGKLGTSTVTAEDVVEAFRKAKPW